MKRDDAEERLSRYLDGSLSVTERAEVETRLETDDAYRGARFDFEAIGQALREVPVAAGKTPEATWADVQREIRATQGRRSPLGEVDLFGSRLGWAGAMMGFLFVCLGAWVIFRGGGPDAVAAVGPPTEVEWVETDLPNAMTMVYQDDDSGLTIIWVQQEEEPERPNVGS